MPMFPELEGGSKGVQSGNLRVEVITQCIVYKYKNH